MAFLQAVIKVYPIIFLGFSFDDLIFRKKLKEIVLLERKKIERVQEVYGGKQKDKAIAGLYVILQDTLIESVVTTEELAFFFNEDYSILDGLIEMNQLPENKWKLVPLTDFNSIIARLADSLGAKTSEFHDLLIRIEKIENINNYFQELEIEILKYSGPHTIIKTFLQDMALKETNYKEDKNSLPNTI